MADHNDFGKMAEDMAADYLQKNGYTIVARNFRFQKAEIDIIAEKDDLIIITEVKARSTDAFIYRRKPLPKRKSDLLFWLLTTIWKNLTGITK